MAILRCSTIQAKAPFYTTVTTDRQAKAKSVGLSASWRIEIPVWQQS
ncbi:MAG: hypothetical protein IIA61_03355 [Candidatus Marinimicrobia bacterium]|nr:hypothetical protein [Candidatus Neomarinimicrobiota bacterium]